MLPPHVVQLPGDADADIAPHCGASSRAACAESDGANNDSAVALAISVATIRRSEFDGIERIESKGGNIAACSETRYAHDDAKASFAALQCCQRHRPCRERLLGSRHSGYAYEWL